MRQFVWGLVVVLMAMPAVGSAGGKSRATQADADAAAANVAGTEALYEELLKDASSDNQAIKDRYNEVVCFLSCANKEAYDEAMSDALSHFGAAAAYHGLVQEALTTADAMYACGKWGGAVTYYEVAYANLASAYAELEEAETAQAPAAVIVGL